MVSRTIARAAMIWLVAGLLFGLAYRTIVQITEFDGITRLAFLHTHSLAVGFILGLVLLLLNERFVLEEIKLFRLGYWHYQAFLAVTVLGLFLRGMADVFLPALPRSVDFSIAGISGIGHIGLSFGLVLIIVALLRRLPAKQC